MPPIAPAVPHRWRLPRGGRPWAALVYLVAETLAGWVTLTVFATIVLIPVWLVAWPRLEQRLLPLSGQRVPVVDRASRFELRWRDWALVLLTPVAGMAGVAVLGLGIAVPVLLLVSPIRIALTGGPVQVLLFTIDTPASQVVAVLAGALLLALAVLITTMLAHGWGRLMSALLSDEQRRLADQLTTLSEGNARELDRLALERRHLERDLHDGAQMHLAAAGTRLGMLQLDAEELPDSPARATLLASIGTVRDQLAAAAEAIRSSVRGLVPAALREGGLCAALDDARQALPLPSRLHCWVPRLDAAVEVGLFFIVTEALANVVRHAQAESVDIRLALTGPELTLEIADDGCGGARPTGTGLLSIQARARLLGGDAVIDSLPGQGTTVTVRIPCPAADERPEKS